jgi:hypothetical protein
VLIFSESVTEYAIRTAVRRHRYAGVRTETVVQQEA